MNWLWKLKRKDMNSSGVKEEEQIGNGKRTTN